VVGKNRAVAESVGLDDVDSDRCQMEMAASGPLLAVRRRGLPACVIIAM